MEVNVNEELYIFGMLFLGGVGSGVLWDLFLPFRCRCGHKRLTVGIADFLLWAFWAAGIFILNLLVNRGQVRWFAFCALVLGSLVYFLTVSRLLRPIFMWIFAVSEKIVRLILKLVLTILAFLYKIIMSAVAFVRRLFSPVMRWGQQGVWRIKRTALQAKLALKKK